MTDPSAQSPRRSRILVALIAVAILAAVLVTVLRGTYRDGPLEPDAPTAQGSKAVVRVLEDLGTSAEPQRRTTEAAQTLEAGGTVLVTTPNLLNSAQIDLLAEARETGGGRLVLVQPDFVTVSALAPGVRPSGSSEERERLTSSPDCGEASFGARTVLAAPVEGVSESSTAYTAPEGASSCFALRGGSLVVVTDGVTVLGSASLLSNGEVGTLDNSAVALNALGDPQGLGWYLPSATDPMSTFAPTLLDYLPSWTGPVAVWLLAVTGAALLALSRRHGPVVLEPLPVQVRAQELTIGRARMLHQARAHDHAAAALRAATCARLAHRLGIHRETRLDPLLDALAPHTTLDAARLRHLLGPTPLAGDRELVALAHDLDLLEKEISR
ncbi:DUF4350 domain-containing protein [Brachybacterium hainanense]|uniref:DUF4350 domain-containing protein n=1 Tax=Brachybacterium hainanense TaxID=1541174 RepID=A0ABV6RD41_9MICO